MVEVGYLKLAVILDRLEIQHLQKRGLLRHWVSFDVLFSCDSYSLLAVDLVAAYIKHGIQQRNAPSTEVTIIAL